jgi:hypothetical protein
MSIHHTDSCRTRVLGAVRPIASVLLAIGLTLTGMLPVSAAAAPPPPTLDGVEVVPPAGVDYQYTMEGDAPFNGIRANVYQDGKFKVAFNQDVGGKRAAIIHTGQRRDIFKSNTRYCIGLLAYVGGGANSNSTFSEESERKCFTVPPYADEIGPSPKPSSGGAPKPAEPAPKPEPPKPDVAATRVSGPKELAIGETAEYEVAIFSEGSAITDQALLQINGAGSIQISEVTEASGNGITCQANALGWGCFGSLGGSDGPMAARSALFKVQVLAMGDGPAVLLASANHNRTFEESNEENNVKMLEIAVQ